MLLLVTAMAMPEMAWAEITPKKPSSGDGTSGSPYQIGTAAELYWFAALVNGDTNAPEVSSANTGACATLTADITVNTGVLKYDGTLNNNGSGFKTWTPIGYPYAGTFDGQGHTISGLYFNDRSPSYIGLFGSNSGTIKNVGVVDSYFCGKSLVGGVCGNNDGGTITSCYNTGTISGNRYVGGVCGYNTINRSTNSSGTITGCYNTGVVSGNVIEGIVDACVGGVCGQNSSGTITNCYYLSGTATGGIGSNDVAGSAEAKTTTQFESGEVCYLLNEGKTDGTQIWYQNLSAEGGDAYPHLNDTDKENTTVYGAYKHGETTLTYRNDNNNTHAHPYDSSAADEANGNHDKSYQGNFNWADNDDKTDATVTATFTCSVCGKVETLELTAVHDDEHPNTPAACTEVGYNYFKTSHAFAGAIFTDSYKQTVPVLGHNMNEITLNSATL